MSARFAVTSAPLELGLIAELVLGGSEHATRDDGRAGAVVTFVGTVRGENLGRRVVRLDYEAYAPLAVASFERIAREAAESWPTARLAIHHRAGTLLVGEISIAIAAASPHRAEAFAACRYAIERVKQIAPIWKHEHFEGGETWIEGATADPDDEGARATARSLACA